VGHDGVPGGGGDVTQEGRRGEPSRCLRRQRRRWRNTWLAARGGWAVLGRPEDGGVTAAGGKGTTAGRAECCRRAVAGWVATLPARGRGCLGEGGVAAWPARRGAVAGGAEGRHRLLEEGSGGWRVGGKRKCLT
jgi:hypothetical protein